MDNTRLNYVGYPINNCATLVLKSNIVLVLWESEEPPSHMQYLHNCHIFGIIVKHEEYLDTLFSKTITVEEESKVPI